MIRKKGCAKLDLQEQEEAFLFSTLSGQMTTVSAFWVSVRSEIEITKREITAES